MSPIQILLLLALVAYAIYRQSIRHVVVGHSRFKLALIYGIAGLAVGGFSRPDGWTEVGLLVFSLALSAAVGLARGLYTRLWVQDGRVWSQGTPLTIGLFLALVLVKFGIGTWAYFAKVSDDGGFGEILVMIAIMVAFQAQLVWQRAQRLPDAPADIRAPQSVR